MAADVNRLDATDPASPDEELVGHEDWSTLQYYFIETAGFAGTGHGESLLGGEFTADMHHALDLVGTTPNERYVAAVYLDVLRRPVDAAGLTYWSSQLDAGAPRSAVSAAIDTSDEYYEQIVIAPAYFAYLGRAADDPGLSYWDDQMKHHGLTDEGLEAGFIGSAEFYTKAGGTDPTWVDALYQTFLGRPAEAQGKSYWLGQLSAGETRPQVAFGFAASVERERQRVSDDYMHYLVRQPDEQGLEFWVNRFAQGETNEELITGFVASDEYFRRVTS